MIRTTRSNFLMLAVTAVALTGCVAAVPPQSSLTVIPGQGKTEADLRADDASCRAQASTTAAATATGAPASTVAVAPVTAEQYYACMAARGEAVIEQQTQVVPVYSGYAPGLYPAYAYGYPYPYAGGYYPYGYGYPYYGGYYGPYVGFGIGFGYGGFYGRGWRGGYGGYRGGYGGFRGGYGHYGGFRGGYGGHGGFRGPGPGGGFHGGGFRR